MNLPATCLYDQIALGIDLELERPLKIERDGPRVSTGSDHKVELDLALVPVIDEVDTGIDIVVDYLPISRNVGSPITRIVPDEVVAFAWQWLESRQPSCRIGANNSHAKCRAVALHRFLQTTVIIHLAACLAVRARQGKDGFRRAQKQSIVGTTGQEIKTWFGLSMVDFKSERHLRINLEGSLFEALRTQWADILVRCQISSEGG